MNKIYLILIVVLLISAFGGGYLSANITTKTQQAGIPVEHIVSLSAACTEILYAIGAGDKIVGVDQASIDYANSGSQAFTGAPGNLANYPTDVPSKTNVGKMMSPNIETIIGLKPDLVFSWYFNTEVNKNIGDKGISVYSVNPKSSTDVINLIKSIGAIVGKSTEAEQVAQQMQSRMDAVTSKLSSLTQEQKPLIYYELSPPLKTVNSSTFTGELISLAAGTNIAANQNLTYPLLTNEYIVNANPDVIVVVSYGASVNDIKSRAGWQDINAVKNNKVYVIESGWVTASPRLVLGLEQFAKWLHPDLFS